jgi:hypothetical protein
VRSFADRAPTPEDNLEQCIPLVHIHGFLDRTATGEGVNVVFSEVDYIEWDERRSSSSLTWVGQQAIPAGAPSVGPPPGGVSREVSAP